MGVVAYKFDSRINDDGRARRPIQHLRRKIKSFFFRYSLNTRPSIFFYFIQYI